MRQRRSPDDDDDGSTEHMLDMTQFSSSSNHIPSALKLLSSAPLHSGYVYKQGTQWFPCCPCFKPKWNRRLFILKGNFLFRFSSEVSESPKGTPMPVENVTCTPLEPEDDEDPDYYYFKVSSIRKTYKLRCGTSEERDDWIRHLRTARRRVVEQSLGHRSVSKEDLDANTAGEYLVKRGLDRERMEGDEADSRGLEMSTFMSY